MNKINNNKILLGLGGLATLTLLTVSTPVVASADTAGYVTPYNSTYFNGVSPYDQYNTYQGQTYNNNPTVYPVYTNPNPTPVYTPVVTTTPTIYSSATNPNQVSSIKKPIAKAKTTTSTASNLAANAIFGSNSFMPSGIIQWVLFAILILLVVILVRKIYGADQAYNAAPLKHD